MTNTDEYHLSKTQQLTRIGSIQVLKHKFNFSIFILSLQNILLQLGFWWKQAAKNQRFIKSQAMVSVTVKVIQYTMTNANKPPYPTTDIKS